MKSQKLENINMNVGEANKRECGNEELVKRETVEETPFTIISVEDKKHFGVMGEYRITEERETKEEVKKEVEEITWNRIVQVIMILEEIREKNNKTKK